MLILPPICAGEAVPPGASDAIKDGGGMAWP